MTNVTAAELIAASRTGGCLASSLKSEYSNELVSELAEAASGRRNGFGYVEFWSPAGDGAWGPDTWLVRVYLPDGVEQPFAQTYETL